MGKCKGVKKQARWWWWRDTKITHIQHQSIKNRYWVFHLLQTLSASTLASPGTWGKRDLCTPTILISAVSFTGCHGACASQYLLLRQRTAGGVYADSKNSMFKIQQAVRVWAIQISPLMGPFEPANPPKEKGHQVSWILFGPLNQLWILFGPLNQLAAQEGPTIKTVWTSCGSSAYCQQHVI